MEVRSRHPGEGDLQGEAVVHRLAKLDVGLAGEVEDTEQLTGSEAVRLSAEAVEAIVGHVEDLLGCRRVLDQEERSELVHECPEKFPRLLARADQDDSKWLVVLEAQLNHFLIARLEDV